MSPRARRVRPANPAADREVEDAIVKLVEALQSAGLLGVKAWLEGDCGYVYVNLNRNRLAKKSRPR
jgi:hypothetical protein